MGWSEEEIKNNLREDDIVTDLQGQIGYFISYENFFSHVFN